MSVIDPGIRKKITNPNEYLEEYYKNKKAEEVVIWWDPDVSVWEYAFSYEEDDFEKEPRYSLFGSILISNFSNLNFLYLSANELKELSIDNCPKLESFCCYDNEISKINFSQEQPCLKYLDCSSNEIEELDLTKFPNLEHLDMSNNPLKKKELDFSHLTKLETLTLDNCNSLKNIILPTSLQYLSLKNGHTGPHYKKTPPNKIDKNTFISLLKKHGKNLFYLNILGLDIDLKEIKSLKEILSYLSLRKLEELHID